MIYFSLLYVAVSIQHADNLFPYTCPFGHICFEISKKGFLSRAAIVILIVEMVGVLTIYTMWVIREARMICSGDLERNR